MYAYAILDISFLYVYLLKSWKNSYLLPFLLNALPSRFIITNLTVLGKRYKLTKLFICGAISLPHSHLTGDYLCPFMIVVGLESCRFIAAFAARKIRNRQGFVYFIRIITGNSSFLCLSCGVQVGKLAGIIPKRAVMPQKLMSYNLHKL